MPRGRKKSVKEVSPTFSVHLQVGSLGYDGKAETLALAVDKTFEETPKVFKAFGRISFTSTAGQNSLGLRLLPFQLQRYKFRPDWRQLLVKRLAVTA
jgi:hypothetical protein